MFKDAVRPQYALSIDPLGGNLPKAGPGPWTFIRVVSLVDREVRPAFDADEALRDVREAGYALITSPFNAD